MEVQAVYFRNLACLQPQKLQFSQAFLEPLQLNRNRIPQRPCLEEETSQQTQRPVAVCSEAILLMPQNQPEQEYLEAANPLMRQLRLLADFLDQSPRMHRNPKIQELSVQAHRKELHCLEPSKLILLNQLQEVVSLGQAHQKMTVQSRACSENLPKAKLTSPQCLLSKSNRRSTKRMTTQNPNKFSLPRQQNH